MNRIETKPITIQKEQEEAELEIWNYALGYSKIAAVKCAIDLGVPEAIEKHGPMSLTELSTTLNTSPSFLFRIMRFLVHHKIFKEVVSEQEQPGSTKTYGYIHTPLSRRIVKHKQNNMAALVQLEATPVMLSPWLCLGRRVANNGKPAFEHIHGDDLWAYAASDPFHSGLINEAMACDAELAVPIVIEECRQVFNGVNSVVDVGGGIGTASSLLIKGIKEINKAINFDLPHVVSVAPALDGVEHVGGDMFVSVPQADAAFIKWVLHDWNDEDCVKILKKCKEAIPKDKGKVIIVEAILSDEEEKKDKYEEVKLMLDLTMMAHTNSGKERTLKEWNFVLNEAGFSHYNVFTIRAVQSVIVAFP